MSNISLPLLLVFNIFISLFSFYMLLRKRLLGESAVKSRGVVLWSATASFKGLVCEAPMGPPSQCPSPLPKKITYILGRRSLSGSKDTFQNVLQKKNIEGRLRCINAPVFHILEIKCLVLLMTQKNAAVGLLHSIFLKPEFKFKKRSCCNFAFKKASGTSKSLGAK